MIAKLKAKIPVAVHWGERALHLPYFGGVALHYGPFSLIGGTATLLLLVSVLALLSTEEAAA
jgi:hypothetical protein